MPRPVLFSCVCIVGMSAGWPADTGVVIKQDIRLDGPEALARLQASNPDHYARAERILAAANQLCRPGPEALQFARFSASDISCAESFLRTSNPPKREIRFRLDSIRYAALVVVSDDPPRLMKTE